VKKRIIRFLVWLIDKLDQRAQIQKQFIYTDRIEIVFKKYVPQDGMWHYVQLKFGAWCMAGSKDVKVRDKTLVECPHFSI